VVIDAARSLARPTGNPQARLSAGRILETASAADLMNQARHQVRAGAELLFAAGGDGTLQGLVN